VTARRAAGSRTLVLAVLGLLLAGALSYVALRTGPLAPTRVTVTRAAVGTLQPALLGIGTVEARRSYAVGPTAAARVLRVAVDVGDSVTAGQLLAELDPVDLDERTVALDAALARAQSAIAAADAQCADAAARRELAGANLRRNTELSAQDFISATALEARRQEHASADAALAAAQANQAAATQDRRRLAAERAALLRQRENLRLIAPAAGLVTAREAEAGTSLVAGQPVLRLIDPSTLWLRVRFDQGRAGGLEAGAGARIALRSDPEQPLPGRVARIEAVSDAVTEERIALVTFDRVPAQVSVGELGEVTVALTPRTGALLLPNAALKRRGEQLGVWQRDGSALRFVPVRVGATGLDGQVQALDGLRAGDEVIVYSDKELRESSRVAVVESLLAADAARAAP
jgi:HlyD family secretion protein